MPGLSNNSVRITKDEEIIMIDPPNIDDTTKKRKGLKIKSFCRVLIFFGMICMLFTMSYYVYTRHQKEKTSLPNQIEEKTPLPNQIEENTPLPNQIEVVEFINDKNRFEIPIESMDFIIDLNVTAKEHTNVKIFGTVNDGEKSYNGEHFCNQTCSIKLKIREKLVAGKHLTVMIKTVDSLKGILRFLPVERDKKSEHQIQKIL